MTTSTAPLSSTQLDQLSIDTLRLLAVDAVEKAKSGHPGAPLGCAPIAYLLYHKLMKHNPANAKWADRDRFVLSNGHASALLYSVLHLSGYKVSLDDLKSFRQWHSITPGHPESIDTEGVEVTTGPLGQGVANAVGMAVAAKMAEAHFNTPEHVIFDHHIVCLAGDGCMQEGVAMEAVEFAGHQQLDNLILIYDSNAVTLDAMAKETQSEDTGKRFEAIGFDVQLVDGHEMEAFAARLREDKPLEAFLQQHTRELRITPGTRLHYELWQKAEHEAERPAPRLRGPQPGM